MSAKGTLYCLGIVTARGGSKRLPGKNLIPLGGKPLIAWTIASARSSTTLSRCLVSTDSSAIMEAARQAGGEAPFLRPQELAQDDTDSVSVVRHAVQWHEANGGPRSDLIVLLQPTSPLRGPDDIDACVRLVAETGADSAQTVALDHMHPWHRYFLRDGRLVALHPEAAKLSRGQDQPPLYRPTGSVYVARRELVMERGILSGADHRGCVRDFESSIDIDDEWDFVLAEAIAKRRTALRTG